MYIGHFRVFFSLPFAEALNTDFFHIKSDSLEECSVLLLLYLVDLDGPNEWDNDCHPKLPRRLQKFRMIDMSYCHCSDL